jgi:uncharacterized NAD(P)/FAD-binding protein YdhS
VVDTLVEIGHISGERGQHAKQLYERLHSALVGAMQQEKSLLEQARQLAKEAQVMLQAWHTGSCTGISF